MEIKVLFLMFMSEEFDERGMRFLIEEDHLQVDRVESRLFPLGARKDRGYFVLSDVVGLPLIGWADGRGRLAAHGS